MEYLKDGVRLLWLSSLRSLMLAALVGTGLWRSAAVAVVTFLAELGQELEAHPKPVRKGFPFWLALYGVTWLCVNAGKGIKKGNLVGQYHGKVATRVDNALMAKFLRLS